MFEGSIPDIYDDLLVPLIFEPYADDLAHRAAQEDPADLLELAAGSGVVSRAVARALPQSHLVVTDLSPAMLERAAESQPDPGRIDWRQADAMDLPFDPDSFDVVLCQFGAMFFPDRVQAYREARRVLRRSGVFIFNMWDRIDENDFANEVTSSLAEVFPSDPPDFLARIPHGHHDPAVYMAELGAAGFEDIRVDPLEAMSVASDPSIPAIAYCQGTPLRTEIEARAAPSLEDATSVATDAIAGRFGAGRVEGRIRGFVITAS